MSTRPVTPIGKTPSVKSPPRYPRPAQPGFLDPVPQPIGRPRQGPTVIPRGGRRRYTKRRRRSNKKSKTKHRRYK